MSPRKALPTALALGLTLATGAHADEGMWMPTQLPDLAQPLQAAGFKGNPADLANVTAPPLSAVVRAGGGTGSFVSADGLLLTNHHVAMGVIQYNSSPWALGNSCGPAAVCLPMREWVVPRSMPTIICERPMCRKLQF